MPVTGWVISSIVAAMFGSISSIIIAPLNKKVVRDVYGKVDFTKTNLYFFWTRWDYVMIITAIYSFLCLVGLLIFLLKGDNIQQPAVQFFIHQTVILIPVTFGWFISRITLTLRGIKQRWHDEIE